MADVTQPHFVQRLFQRKRLSQSADILAIAVAVSLPWSTSATGILAALWAVTALLSIDSRELRRILALPAAALPMALVAMALVGTLWASGSLSAIFSDFKVFIRLAAIALLLAQFRRSNRGSWVIVGFLASCTVLLSFSWLRWSQQEAGWLAVIAGVPVKDYVVQSSEFLICSFELWHLALDAWKSRAMPQVVGFGLLAILFLANIVFVATDDALLHQGFSERGPR